MNSNLFSLLLVCVHEDPLNEIVAILITSNVNERDTWSIWMSSGDDIEVTIKKLDATNLETLLDNFRSILVDTVAIGIDQDVIDDPTLVRRGAVLTEMLNTPIAKLAMSDKINVGDNFLNSRAFLILDTILKDVLNDQTASLSKSDFMPHAT